MNDETLRRDFRRQENVGTIEVRDRTSRECGLVATHLAHAYGGQQILDDTGISVKPGRIVGLVGRSGAGKTTLGRILSGRIPADSGVVSVDGTLITSRCVPEVAYLGQAPREACNPRWTLRRIIGEPVHIAALNGRPMRGTDTDIVGNVAAAVLLDDALLHRTPEEVSDGQLQRAVIARALAQQPKYLVCDEPTSMLDPITTAAVVKTLRAVCAGSAGNLSGDGSGAGLLFISHDLRLLKVIADDIYQLEDGKITRA